MRSRLCSLADKHSDDTDRRKRRCGDLSTCISNYKVYNCAIFTRISRIYRARLAGGFLQQDSHQYLEQHLLSWQISAALTHLISSFRLFLIHFPPFTQHSFTSHLLQLPRHYFTDGGGSKRKNIFNLLSLILLLSIIPFSFHVRKTRKELIFGHTNSYSIFPSFLATNCATLSRFSLFTRCHRSAPLSSTHGWPLAESPEQTESPCSTSRTIRLQKPNTHIS